MVLPKTNLHQVKYPRRKLARTILRGLGRLVLSVFFRLEIKGLEHFPPNGPLIVVGNHSAIMEVVMMVVYPPRQVEVLGSTDVPHEAFTDIISRLYGFIPFRRGYMDRQALRQCMDVLTQGGWLGMFPEGGIWQVSERRVQSGVAWLSEMAFSPVLPVYFSGVGGALNAALRLKRPRLAMIIGKVIPPVTLPEGKPKKEILQSYANMVMDEVEKLKPEQDDYDQPMHVDETFSLETAIFDHNHQPQPLPASLQIQHSEALAKFLQYPTILKIFRANFRMPIDALQKLSTHPTSHDLNRSCKLILDYLENENPYLLTYRFGQKEGEDMRLGLVELEALTRWLGLQGFSAQITPVRRYKNIETGEEIVQTDQGDFKNWM